MKVYAWLHICLPGIGIECYYAIVDSPANTGVPIDSLVSNQSSDMS